MKRPQIKAFTLVELIIVITILAILATIGFMSYQSYTLDARDANRVATVKQMSNGLDITFVKKAAYPMPDGTVSTGTIDGVSYAYKGIIGDTISQLIKMDKSVDPSSKAEYAYGINRDRNQYQIALVLENTVSKTNTIIDSTYAAGGETAKVTGNYRGVIKYSTGGSSYVSNIPSLVWSNTGTVNLMATSTYYVVNKKSNLPYKLSASSVLGTKSPDTILKEMTGTGVATLTGVNISILTKENFDTIFSGALLASFNVQGVSTIDNTVLKESVKSFILGTSATTTSTIAAETPLYTFTSHNFTNCGITGRAGPTLANCTSDLNYTAAWTDDISFYNNSSGIQLWTVPETGIYTIDTYGAQGGTNNSTYARGARMKGNFYLIKGDKLKILVGQQGQVGSYISGGGGSFITSSSNTLLIVAGGGGGYYDTSGNTASNGKIENSGSNGTSASSGGIGGINGNGGQENSCNYNGGPGGGYSGEWNSYYLTGGWGGRSFINGGLGGSKGTYSSSGDRDGGFGGGGGSGYGAGGGGGYSGGGGGSNCGSGPGNGGGGGSFSSTTYNGQSVTNTTQTAGANSGHGSVTITKL